MAERPTVRCSLCGVVYGSTARVITARFGTGRHRLTVGSEFPHHCCEGMPRDLQAVALRLAGEWLAAVAEHEETVNV